MNKLTRNRSFLWCILLQCCCVHVKSRHIVFIVADDLGWNDIGFHNKDIISPNIDNLAKTGVILDQAYVQPLCSPSRSAFMTGMYPFKTGLQHLVISSNQQVCSPLNLPLLPQKLKKLGYKTHIIGKWHLGFCNWNCTPNFRGFDSFYGYYNSREDYYTNMNVEGQDFRNNTYTSNASVGIYSTYDYSKMAQHVIEQHNKNDPLFLYLPFQAVHEPIEVPIEYEKMYPNIVNTNRRKFSGMVTALDDAVGNITQALKAKGLYEDTLIIFTADNGGWVTHSGNNLPLRGSKITIYEGGTRVVAFVHGAGLEKTGYKYDGMIHAVDWNPTIIAAAGGIPDTNIDGINQWNNIQNNGTHRRNEFIYNLDDMAPYDNGHAAIRMGDYKLVVGRPGLYPGWYPLPATEKDNDIKEVPYDSKWDNKTQLFNLRDDPNEYHDLSEKYPKIVQKLKNRMAEYHKHLIPANYPGPTKTSDPRDYNGFFSPGWC